MVVRLYPQVPCLKDGHWLNSQTDVRLYATPLPLSSTQRGTGRARGATYALFRERGRRQDVRGLVPAGATRNLRHMCQDSWLTNGTGSGSRFYRLSSMPHITNPSPATRRRYQV